MRAFAIRNIEPMKAILGIEVENYPKGILLSHQKYILGLLTKIHPRSIDKNTSYLNVQGLLLKYIIN